MKRQFDFFKKLLIINCALLIGFSSCSVSHQIAKSADKILLKDSSISSGHIGISIYEPATNSYWYNYDAAKYFVPASNTKLFTCYAVMKYLGDSLVGLRYSQTNTDITIYPAGDPTFLHPDFIKQPVFEFLVKKTPLKINIDFEKVWKEQSYGKGWVLDDYSEYYSSQRSALPIYGNIVKFETNADSIYINDYVLKFPILAFPSFFTTAIKPDVDTMPSFYKNFFIKRIFDDNTFLIKQSNQTPKIQLTPFNTDNETIEALLEDTLMKRGCYKIIFTKPKSANLNSYKLYTIHSQPTDSLLKPMMHRSDNFFAEQTLLMVSNEHLGYMNDEDIIDTLLNTDLKDVPQKPKWIDGSGLSRYNLFTPQSFVYILNKMKNEFGLKRLEVILPTGGEGTLKNYYLQDSSFIYAKTGSLSNNFSLSGFLITKKNKLLIFSILVNNFQNDAAPVHLAIQQFIENIRDKY